MRLWAAPDSDSISFVSYSSFASMRLAPQRIDSYLVAIIYYDALMPLI